MFSSPLFITVIPTTFLEDIICNVVHVVSQMSELYLQIVSSVESVITQCLSIDFRFSAVCVCVCVCVSCNCCIPPRLARSDTDTFA